MGQSPNKKSGASKTSTRGSDRVHDGECWAVPLPGRGFCALVVARAPSETAEVDFAFAYLKAKPTDYPPNPEELGPAESWDCAWLGLVSTQPMRKGRWTRCGVVPGFDRAAWPIPPGRESAVDERKPAAEWGQYPWGEMWSIETTADEPSMTLIANTPATREEALRFPRLGVVSAASSLEKALAKHFQGRRPGFWDMKLDLQTIPPGTIKLWRQYAERVRSSWSSAAAQWLPAGRRTDRQLKAGMWMGLPLTGGGFGAALLVAKPEPHLRFFSDAVVMAMRQQWDRWPTLKECVALTPEDGAVVAQTSMICVRGGRWRVLGEHPGFEAEQWVWPLPWTASGPGLRAGILSIAVDRCERAKVRIDPKVLALDPHAGQRCNGSSSYGSLELHVPRIMAGTDPFSSGESSFHDGVVTPERLAAWRRINAEIRRALAARK